MQNQNPKKIIRLGARGSNLSRWQANLVKEQLEKAHQDIQVEVDIIETRGDQITDIPLAKIGAKGLFTAELEAALRSGQIACAVHSQKDLPVVDPEGLILAAILERENPADALISRSGLTLEQLPKGARVGTSSPRRAAQLLHFRPDLVMLDLRGNVDTRVSKALDPNGPYDAIVLAYAGLARLGKTSVITETISYDIMLPAPAQGALAIQIFEDGELAATLSKLNHPQTSQSTTAERAFLQGLGGGCSLPIAALAEIRGNSMLLRGRVASADGQKKMDVEIAGDPTQAAELGLALSEKAIRDGVHALLEPSL